jgi:hypothetical protein
VLLLKVRGVSCYMEALNQRGIRTRKRTSRSDAAMVAFLVEAMQMLLPAWTARRRTE